MVWGREVEKRVGSVFDAVAVIGAVDGIDLPVTSAVGVKSPDLQNPMAG